MSIMPMVLQLYSSRLMLQALVRPSRSGQDSFLWLAAVPAQFTERKRTYLELLTHCIKENGKCT